MVQTMCCAAVCESVCTFNFTVILLHIISYFCNEIRYNENAFNLFQWMFRNAQGRLTFGSYPSLCGDLSGNPCSRTPSNPPNLLSPAPSLLPLMLSFMQGVPTQPTSLVEFMCMSVSLSGHWNAVWSHSGLSRIGDVRCAFMSYMFFRLFLKKNGGGGWGGNVRK